MLWSLLQMYILIQKPCIHRYMQGLGLETLGYCLLLAKNTSSYCVARKTCSPLVHLSFFSKFCVHDSVHLHDYIIWI